MPDSTELRVAIWRSNMRFLCSLIAIFFLGHLDALTSREDPATCFILAGLWWVICFSSTRLMKWILKPMQEVPSGKQ